MPPGGPRGPPIGLRPRPGSGDTPDSISKGTRRRIGHGFLWGLIATLAMSAATYVGLRTGLSPQPEAIAIALADELIDIAIPGRALMAGALVAHLFYGGFWGSVLSVARPAIRVHHGLAMGIALWLVANLLVFPMVDWGMFGRDIDFTIAAASLVSHLVYGLTLGLLFEREHGDALAAEELRQVIEQAGS